MAWPLWRAATASRRPGTTAASHSTDGAASIDTSTSIGSPLHFATWPSLMPTKRGTAPCCRRMPRGHRGSARHRRHPPRAIAMRRVDAVLARAREQRQRRLTARLRACGARFSTFGSGSGSSSCPDPSATACASSSATLRSCATTRSRTATVCTLVSSKRNARMMCCFSTSLWLFQNKRGLVVVLGELLRLAAHLVALPSVCGNDMKPHRRPGRDSRRRANSARRRRGRAESPAGACHRAGCCAPARPAR